MNTVNGSDPGNLQAVCLNCAHAFVQRLPPPNIATVRVCKLLPPTPLTMRDAQGNIRGFAAASPIVSDGDFCAHFMKRQSDDSDNVKGANDETISSGENL